jgi:hypothetical protein
MTSRSSFVKNYFMGERGPETAAMATGTKVHKLIEAGLIKAQCSYEHNEEVLTIELGDGRKFLGVPDSYEIFDKPKSQKAARFVDYKTGKLNDWKNKLPIDIKMKATAWLVWKTCGEPEEVVGKIEFFQTTWNPEAHEVVPIEGQESEVVSITYSKEDLQSFSTVIKFAMDDVNAFYEKWKESTGEFVNQDDIEKYASLKVEIDRKEAEMDEVGERILAQMDFGGEENHKTPIGTFYVKTTNTYEYPAGLRFKWKGYELGVEDADEVSMALKAAKKNYELVNEPTNTKRSISFRGAKEK